MLFVEEPAGKKKKKTTNQKRQQFKKAATATLNESQLIMNENPLASGALTPPSEKVAQPAQPRAFMPKHIHRDSGDGDTKDNSAWVNSQSGCPD